MITDKKLQKILIPVLIIVIIFSISKSIKSGKEDDNLKAKNDYVIGEIIDHKISGIAENYFVEYEYFVDGKKFEKTE